MYEGLTYDLDQIMPTVVDSGLFVSVCNILQPDGLFDTGGAPSGNYTPVAGLQSIVCMRAPLRMASIGGTEQDSVERQQSTQPWHLLLDTYYPALDGHTEYQAVVDGVTHKIVAIEHDSQHIMTRLHIEEVTE